jgi:hypothetical protein
VASGRDILSAIRDPPAFEYHETAATTVGEIEVAGGNTHGRIEAIKKARKGPPSRGIIPASLLRGEITGLDDEIKALLKPDDVAGVSRKQGALLPRLFGSLRERRRIL